MHDVSLLFMECIRLREMWNFRCCGVLEPIGLTYENHCNMEAYNTHIQTKKLSG